MTAGITNVTFGVSRQPAPTNTVSGGMVVGLLKFAVASGADRDALIAAAGLDVETLTPEDARIPFSKFTALYAAAEERCGDPAFALHLGEDVSTMDSLVVCHVGSACDTMAAALGAMNRYGRLAVDVETIDGGDFFQVEHSPSGCWLIDASIYPDDVPYLTETSFTRLIVGTRQLTGRNFVRAVHLVRSAPPHHAEYERIFRAPVAFGRRRNAMLMDPDWFALPLGVTSHYAGAVFEAHANALVERLQPAGGRRAAVEEIVRSRLDSGLVSMDYVARELGISRQTLYRQLRLERTTFEQILTHVRRDVAKRLLSDGVSVSETAHRLGFSDQSAFSRAFKRWNGRSPR